MVIGHLCSILHDLPVKGGCTYCGCDLMVVGFAAIYAIGRRLGVIVFNATFNNISVILWWSVLLVEETRVPGQNHCRNVTLIIVLW
jgi:hypothetical protein